MHVGKKNLTHSYYMNRNGLKTVEVEKDLENRNYDHL